MTFNYSLVELKIQGVVNLFGLMVIIVTFMFLGKDHQNCFDEKYSRPKCARVYETPLKKIQSQRSIIKNEFFKDKSSEILQRNEIRIILFITINSSKLSQIWLLRRKGYRDENLYTSLLRSGHHFFEILNLKSECLY